MTNLNSEITKKSNGSNDGIESSIQNIEHHLEKMAHDFGKKIGSVTAKVANSTTEYAKTGQNFIKENPGKSIVYAVSAGMLAGSLITLAMRRRS